MGHIRLGRLPKTKTWAKVFEAIGAQNLNAADLATAISVASNKQFEVLKHDEGVNYCFFILVKVISASQSNNFEVALNDLGINPEKITSGISFVHQVASIVNARIFSRQKNPIFSRMAELSLREVLSANIIEQSNTLFGTSLDDVRLACKNVSTKKNFAMIGREFFADLMNRTIKFVTDKEMSNFVGPGHSMASPAHVNEFYDQLKRYCYDVMPPCKLDNLRG